jgi:hypothetical protein
MNTILKFIFSNLNAIILVIWFLFLIIVTIRFFRPNWVKNISYKKLLLIVLGFHIVYGIFITWGQYYVWAKGSGVTKVLLHLPLSSQVPFPHFLEWSRFIFENNIGYFSYYVLGRFWSSIFILFFTSLILYFIFKIWKSYRGGFSEEGPLLLFILMLVSGWPGIIVSVALGFIFATLFFIFYFVKNMKDKNPPKVIFIEGFFILSTLIALLFTKVIMFYML